MSRISALGLTIISLVSFFSCKSPKQQTVAKLPKPVKEVWVDRFDSISGTAITGGTWFALSDRINGGASNINPSNIKNAYLPIPERGNNTALKFSYDIHKKDFAWPYVTFGVPITTEQLTGSISMWKAIAYDFKGNGHTFTFQTSDIKDWSFYQKKIEGSDEWTTVIIPFAELQQPGWGRPMVFDASLITGLAWAIHGKEGDKGEIFIDNVRFLKRLPPPSPTITENTNKASYSNSEKSIDTTSSIVTESLTKENSVTTHIPEKIKVADWFGFKKAAYSLSFDDGLISQYQYAAPILNKYNIKGTFYVLTGSLEEDTAKKPGWRFGYWHQFIELYNQGHELGAHTVTHPRLTSLSDGDWDKPGTLLYELTEPKKTFLRKVPEARIISFAYPMVDYNQHVMDESSNYYVSSRAGGNLMNKKNPEWNELKSYIIEYTDARTLANDNQKMIQLQNHITATINNSGWSILTVHDMLPLEEAIKAKDSWHPVSVESFEPFVKWLKEKEEKNELWIETVGNITRYTRERESLTVNLLKDDSLTMVIQLTDGLPDKIFNYPLSLEITVPDTWKKVLIKHKSSSEYQEVKGGKIYINAIPNNEVIEITKVQ